MSMTKRDFEAIAKVLRAERELAMLPDRPDPESYAAARAIALVAHELAATFRYANPRFDANAFLIAAGVRAEAVK